MMIMRLAPAGVFCLIAKTFAELGFSAMVPIIQIYGGCPAGAAGAVPRCVSDPAQAVYRPQPVPVHPKFAPSWAFAFSTATSNATIPLPSKR